MNYQEPAVGILKNSDFGDAKMYTITCDCDDPACNHVLWVEASDIGISVNIHTTEKTEVWKVKFPLRYDIDNKFLQWFDWFWKDLVNGLLHRLKITRDVWFKGYVEYHGEIILNRQRALNYAEALKRAINDVEEFNKTRR